MLYEVITLTLEYAQETLAAAGVVEGVDLKELTAALNEAREGRAVSSRVIARGSPAVPAGGYRLNWIIRVASGAALTMRADGSADYKNQDRSTVVVEGQPLLELLAIGVEGQDGRDVLGGAIPAPKDPRVVDPVITSYSIHYTKLYEPNSSRMSMDTAFSWRSRSSRSLSRSYCVTTRLRYSSI